MFSNKSKKKKSKLILTYFCLFDSLNFNIHIPFYCFFHLYKKTFLLTLLMQVVVSL